VRAVTTQVTVAEIVGVNDDDVARPSEIGGRVANRTNEKSRQ
jgi:hypothetical protein